MNENKTLRRYNRSVYDSGIGQRIYQCHTGIIHYSNKLGVGDGERGMRKIDNNLYYNNSKEGWEFLYNNFHPFFPKYSNGEILFRDIYKDKDQTLVYVAQNTSGVLGEYITGGIEGLTDNDCVLYPNAYGEGKDLILFVTRSRLMKIVRIRSGYYSNNDMTFTFEINASEFPIYRGTNNSFIYEVQKSGEKVFDTQKYTFFGGNIPGSTVLLPYVQWYISETGIISKKADVTFISQGGRYYLEKTLSGEFLIEATGDVYIDTVTSYYSGAGDGYVRNFTAAGVSWATTHDATDGEQAAYTNAALTIGVFASSSTDRFAISRGFIPIDTSGITDTDTIDSADLLTYNTGISNPQNDGYDYMTIVGQTSQADNTSLVVGDFDQCGAVTTPTEGIATGDRKDLGDISGNTTQTWTLNATGLSWISKIGYTLIGMREGHDTTNNAQTKDASGQFNGYSLAMSESANDPYLSITTTAASSTFTPKSIVY